MPLSAFPTPVPHLPLGSVGAAAAIGATFLIHIALVGFILGASALAPFMELAGRRRGGDPRHLRYARSLAHATAYLYSFGATWAVFAVVLLTGIYGNLIGTLLNLLLLPLTIAFGSFFIGIPLMLLYVYRWDQISPRLHLAIGFAFAAVQYIFLFTIVELDSFALTPGSVHASSAAFSPSYPWLLLHYAAANLSWPALLLAAIAVWRLGRATDPAEVAFQRWAARVNFAIGATFLVAQPVTGFLLAATLQQSSGPAFANLTTGGSGVMLVGQVGLLAVVVVGANLVFWQHSPAARGSRAGAGLTVVALLGMAGAAMPAVVIPSGLVALRYSLLLVAFAATAVHLARFIAEHRRGAATLGLPGPAGRLIPVVAVAALALSLYMGVIKENVKLPCAIDAPSGQSSCLMSLHTATQNFDPPRGVLP
ncbi:MAG TPA: cytochrome ubiquinol oxidase subunit I [Verrucomicrobiae bacterium]|nr:cytochrome ubiquinol oxidase subunit I [Verrucomicrobiae bacterium]